MLTSLQVLLKWPINIEHVSRGSATHATFPKFPQIKHPRVTRTVAFIMKPKSQLLKYHEFECQGKGLTFSSQPRATQLETLTALVEKHRTTKDGRITKPSQGDETRPGTWWEAQVRLYGLKCSDWTEEGMVKTLMDAITTKFAPPAELATIERQLNHDYECIDWDSENQHAEIDENPDISTEEIKEQSSPDEIHPGQNAFLEKERPKHTTQITRLDLWRRARSPPPTPEQRFEKITRLHQKYLNSDEVDDTIFGKWHLHFPDLEVGFKRGGDIWEIHLPAESESCVWVVIHQSHVEGIVQLRWNTPESWKGKSFPFSFRGGETASYYHTSGGGHITFTSTHECSGIFESAWDDPWTFVGRKVSNELPTMNRSRCKRAYEREYHHPKADWEWS